MKVVKNILSDSTGRGTQMALLMASNSNKKNSIYGINLNVQIYSIKVSNLYGITTSEYLHNALEFCKTIDVSIVYISLGGMTYNKQIDDDIKVLKSKNGFVVCSYGDKKTNFLYPADYEGSYCIIAQNQDGSVSPDANLISSIDKDPIKSHGMDIEVLVSGTDEKYYKTKRSGSSYATAIFNGYLSLFIENNNLFTPEISDTILKNNVYVNGFISLIP